MPKDEVFGIGTLCIMIEDCAKPSGKPDGSMIIGRNIADESRQFADTKGPCTHGNSGFGRYSASFGILIKQPTQFVFREKWSMIDADLTNTKPR